MLTTIRQVNEQFFRKFYGLKMPIGGEEKKILCRYAKKSSYDYTEEQDNQVYPCIAIQDYTPVPKSEWYIDMHAYFGGKSVDGLKGYLYQRPIWMEFKYDVSIVSKSYNEFVAMQDYFMQHFVYGKRFLFNQHFEGEQAIGDIVPYTIRNTDVPRTDGCIEMNYEFTCSVWLYPTEPSEVDLITSIVISNGDEIAFMGDENIVLSNQGFVVDSEGKIAVDKNNVHVADGDMDCKHIIKGKFRHTLEEIDDVVDSIGSEMAGVKSRLSEIENTIGTIDTSLLEILGDE